MTTGFFPATVMPNPDWWQALWPQPGRVLADLAIAPGTEMAVDLCCGDNQDDEQPGTAPPKAAR